VIRRAAVLALALALPACGGRLEGERASEPVRDWSFVAQADDVAFETSRGRRFRWVQPAAHAHEGALYLYVSTVLNRRDAALEEVLAGGELRMRAGGRLYDLRAVRLTEPAQIDPILPSLLSERMEIEAVGAHLAPSPARYPGTQLRQWFFRLQ
jgi:hypothetical protein